MTPNPHWQYDEFEHAGVNYADPVTVTGYDSIHQRFRDFQAEAGEIVRALGLSDKSTVIDMGCGTGAFTIPAALYCRKIHAVDVSRPMLDCLARKASAAGLANIALHHGGFLTYAHADDPVDAVVSTTVLHHLPDFWKLVGLKRMAAVIKPGGTLYLADIVFSFDVSNCGARMDDWVNRIARVAGKELAVEAEVHARREYSTWSWIMDGLLKRAGFAIEETVQRDEYFICYRCRRDQ